MTVGPTEISVCPKCGFAFRPLEAVVLQCPRLVCGFSWNPIGLTEAQAAATEKRVAEYSLKVVAGEVAGQFLIKSDRPMILGRERDCDIRLTNLQVSRHHTEIELRDGKIWVRDLSTRAATLIDRVPVPDEGQELQLGQRLIVGGAVFQMEICYRPRTEHSSHVDSQKIILDSVSLEVLVHGIATDGFDVQDKAISIGRQADRDVVLQHIMVSRKHAKVMRDEGHMVVLDTGSSTGTFVNGKSILRKEIQKGDRLQIGPYLFNYDGKSFKRQLELTRMSLVALDLSKRVGNEKILDNVSLAVRPGEFVGVLGPSGAGKSTLLNALNGLRPASSGNVLLNGQDLYENYDQWRSIIGYVPQDNIVHNELTVEAAISYAARLRLPNDSTNEDIRAAVNDVIKTVKMEHRRNIRVGRLSGGERKRVSVAVELVGNPALLYLDEPTAALDPGTAGSLMQTFREMANQGRTLVCTTHIMENLNLFHKVIVLLRGKLVYSGPPQDCLTYFNVAQFADLYDKLERKPPEYWEKAFRSTQTYTTCVSEPTAPYRHTLTAEAGTRKDAMPRSGRWSELFTLTSRYFDVYFSDWHNAAWLLAQALIVGLLINWACASFKLAAFLSCISCLWFGCNQAAREIVRERTVFLRERMVGQKVGSYFLSKAIVLLGTVVCQNAMIIALLYLISGRNGVLPPQVAALMLSGIVGTLLGLFVSATAKSEMSAVTIVPLVLIPQIVLAGALMPIPYMNFAARSLSYLCPTRWINYVLDCSLLHGQPVTQQMVESAMPSWQNLFPNYDLRNQAEFARFLGDYGGKEIQLMTPGTLALAVVLVFCIIVFAASLFVLHRRKPE